MKDLRDVFLCHASEDKEAVVRPLADALREEGVTCWVDEAEIVWAESFTKKIGDGLASSRYVIAAISQSFIGKAWPEYELDAALGMEASEGEAKVLPLLVGDRSDLLAKVKQRYPFLRNRKFLFWDGDPQPVVEALQVRLGQTAVTDVGGSESSAKQAGTYVPKLRKDITQRDKDRFLETAFNTVRDYFRQAIDDLQAHYEEVDADFTEIDNEKFRCRMYLQGDLRNECLIRIRAWTSRDSIGYTEGTGILRENSYNEIVRVMDDGSELYLSFSFGSSYSDRSEQFDPAGAAKALWRRFVAPLERR